MEGLGLIGMGRWPQGPGRGHLARSCAARSTTDAAREGITALSLTGRMENLQHQRLVDPSKKSFRPHDSGGHI